MQVTQYTFTYDSRAHNVGIFIGFILFNYTMASLFTYLIFVAKFRAPALPKMFRR